jgi:hypothetical protein
MEENLKYFIDIVTEEPILSVLLVLVFALIIQTILLSLRVGRFLKGGDGKSLEGLIQKLNERTSKLESHAKETTLILKETDERLGRSIQGLSVKRFDPFAGAGGQQSFATAFLSENGNGVVISGIHARDGVRVYAKGIVNFDSERELSEEERGAIAEAKERLL